MDGAKTSSDTESITSRIREEAERRRSSRPESHPLGAAASFALNEFLTAVAAAEGESRVDEQLPDFPRARGWKRLAAPLLSRLVRRLARVMLRKPRKFNSAVVLALRCLEVPIRRMETALLRQQCELEDLRAELELLHESRSAYVCHDPDEEDAPTSVPIDRRSPKAA